jgi:hypothetical protein
MQKEIGAGHAFAILKQELIPEPYAGIEYFAGN